MPDEQFYKALFHKLSDGIYFVDRQRTITYWNQAAEQLTGYKAEEVVGRRCWHNILRHVDAQGNQLCRGWCPLIATMHDGEEREGEVFLHHKDGHRVPMHVRTKAFPSENGIVNGAAEIFSRYVKNDVEGLITRLQQQAQLDHLTQLGNRAYIEQQLAYKLEAFHQLGEPFGVMLIDLDDFKHVNDNHGHLIGDKVIKMVANTLANAVRNVDKLSRWGGDEFLLLLADTDAPTLAATAERIQTLIKLSFIVVNRRIVQVNASIGTALAQQGDTLETLLNRADESLYQHKARGLQTTATLVGSSSGGVLTGCPAGGCEEHEA